MSEPEGLRKALEEAQRYLGELPSPPNEANTCDWVIRPLLLALGYRNHEIHAQAGDVSNKFPDYTILPQSDHTWYLEAKAWNVGLESSHVDQAMNYAHSNGQRWVVLSNGREWRLYDDSIAGKSADRLVATAQLDDSDGLARFLTAIGRDSMLTQRVAKYASERRVRDYLTSALNDPKSAVIQAVLKAVRQNVGNGPITGEAIVDILNAAQARPTPGPSPEPEPRVPPKAVPTPMPRPKDKGPHSGTMSPTLAGLDPGTYQSVSSSLIRFPDGTTKPLRHWKDVLVGVAQWLSESGRLEGRMPMGADGLSRYLMNSQPIHRSGESFKVAYPAGMFFVETQYSARDCIRHAKWLLSECGVPHDAVMFDDP